jgi:hypothetical protein
MYDASFNPKRRVLVLTENDPAPSAILHPLSDRVRNLLHIPERGAPMSPTPDGLVRVIGNSKTGFGVKLGPASVHKPLIKRWHGSGLIKRLYQSCRKSGVLTLPATNHVLNRLQHICVVGLNPITDIDCCKPFGFTESIPRPLSYLQSPSQSRDLQIRHKSWLDGPSILG